MGAPAPVAHSKVGGASWIAPLWGQMAVSSSEGRSESGGDACDPAGQRQPDLTTRSTTEHSTDCANDTNRDDNVLERHHAVLVRAQTLQGFRGLYIVLRHRRKSLFTR